MSGKRKIPGISVYQRGKSWAYLVESEPDLLTGKRNRKYEGGFKTEDEALKAALKAKEALDSGRYVAPSRRTVKAFMAEWLVTVEQEVKPSTFANYTDNTRSYVNPIIGERKLQDITVPVLNEFYRHLLKSGRRKPDKNSAMYEYWKARKEMRGGLGPGPTEISKACGTTYAAARAAVARFQRGRAPKPYTPGLAPKSVKNVHRMLHRALKDAVAWQYMTFNPAEHASLPRQKRKGSRISAPPWTVEQLGTWLRLAALDRFGGLWVLAATTGMRRSELAGVQHDLLELWAVCGACEARQEVRRETCSECDSKDIARYGALGIADTRVVVAGRATDEDGKSDDSVRTIALDPFTVESLIPYLDMIDQERTDFGSEYPDHGKLMVYEDGRRLHPDTVTRRFNRLVDAAGVPRVRLHDVRHTYATLAMDNGVDPKILSDRVGHANMNVTFQIYTHRSTGHDREAAEKMASLIKDAMDRAS